MNMIRYMDLNYLTRYMAEIKLLQGDGDPSKWVGSVSNAQALRERVELAFALVWHLLCIVDALPPSLSLSISSLSFSPSTSLFFPIDLSIYIYLSLSIYLSTYLSIYLSIYFVLITMCLYTGRPTKLSIP